MFDPFAPTCANFHLSGVIKHAKRNFLAYSKCLQQGAIKSCYFGLPSRDLNPRPPKKDEKDVKKRFLPLRRLELMTSGSKNQSSTIEPRRPDREKGNFYETNNTSILPINLNFIAAETLINCKFELFQHCYMNIYPNLVQHFCLVVMML